MKFDRILAAFSFLALWTWFINRRAKRQAAREERIAEKNERAKLFAVVRRAHESGDGDVTQRLRSQR